MTLAHVSSYCKRIATQCTKNIATSRTEKRVNGDFFARKSGCMLIEMTRARVSSYCKRNATQHTEKVSTGNTEMCENVKKKLHELQDARSSK